MKKYSRRMVNKSYFLGLFFLTIFLFGVSGKSLWATDYYVDNTCGYNGNGTSQTCASGAGQPGPFNSLANAAAAVTGSHPGDQLLFKCGQTYTGPFVVGAYGTSGNPFTVSSYGTGAQPTFTGGGTAYPNWGAINIINLSNITLDGLAVTNGGDEGIWIYRWSDSSPTSGITVRNCLCYNNPGAGIAYYNEASISRPNLSDCSFYNNDCYGNASGIYVNRVNYLSIYNNTCHDSALNGKEQYGIGVESGSYLNIYQNMIYNIYDTGIGIYGDSGSDGPASYNQIYRNVVYGTKYDVWAKDITLQGFVGSNNSIYYNILYSTDSHVSHFEDDATSSSGNVFYGNVLADGQYGLQTSGGSWAVRNNTFYNVGTGTTNTSGLTFSNNISYPNSNIPNAITSNPLFTNPGSDWTGFRLQAGSPAIDTGANLGSPYNLALDPSNLVWPPTTADENTYGWSIGAFVYRTGRAPAPPTGLRIVN